MTLKKFIFNSLFVKFYRNFSGYLVKIRQVNHQATQMKMEKIPMLMKMLIQTSLSMIPTLKKNVLKVQKKLEKNLLLAVMKIHRRNHKMSLVEKELLRLKKSLRKKQKVSLLNELMMQNSLCCVKGTNSESNKKNKSKIKHFLLVFVNFGFYCKF